MLDGQPGTYIRQILRTISNKFANDCVFQFMCEWEVHGADDDLEEGLRTPRSIVAGRAAAEWHRHGWNRPGTSQEGCKTVSHYRSSFFLVGCTIIIMQCPANAINSLSFIRFRTLLP